MSDRTIDLAALWASVILIASVVAGLFVVSAEAPALPPCPTEDSVSCHWDAQTQGNGQGRSFTADSEGNVTFVD